MADTGVDTAELQAEIARLREENERLKASPPQREGGALRATAVTLLVVFGIFLTIPGIAAPYLRTQLLDNTRYVETMDNVIKDPAVIDYVATQITDQIFQQVDVQSLVTQYLPPKLSFAAAPLTGQIQSKTLDLVNQALSSDQFKQLWSEINSKAHESIVTYLSTGDSTTLSVNSSNQLVLDLAPIIAQVKQKLVDAGLTFVNSLPTVASSVQIVIGDASFLIQARQFVHFLQIAAWLFPILAIGCFALAVGLSRNRRRTLSWAGLALATGALLTGILLALGRSGFLNGMADAHVPIDASNAVFNAFATYLRNTIRLTILVGLLVALSAVLTGPSTGAVKLRGTIGNALTGAGERSSFDTGGFGRWLAAHRTAVYSSLIGVGALAFLAVNGPTPKFVLVLVFIELLVMAVLQILAAAAHPAEVEGADSSST